MKHAFLILCHNNWGQLIKLVRLLDHENNDIYIHIDQKVKNVPNAQIVGAASNSHIIVYQKYKIYWGDMGDVKAMIYLIEKAAPTNYDYYHILSGMDLPIKPMQEIHNFFEAHPRKEFVQFESEKNLKEDKEFHRRTRLYHFLHGFRHRFRIHVFNSLFTFLERVSLGVQLVLHIDRENRYPQIVVWKGSQWASISNEFAHYIIESKEFIYDFFAWSNSADESFLQTLLYNSKFIENLYLPYDNCSCECNLRLIRWDGEKSKHPHVFVQDDFQEICDSSCFFARKFDERIDSNIIDDIISMVDI